MLKSRTFTLIDLLAAGFGAIIVISISWGEFARETALRPVGGWSVAEAGGAPEMSGRQAEAYREWSEKSRHFGAFAASEGGAWGWTRGYNDSALADEVALTNCARRAVDCRIIARAMPAERPGEGEIAVSPATLTRFLEYEAYDGPKAFAIARTGASGWVWEARTVGRAKAGALRRCEERARKDSRYPLEEPVCRVIHAVW